jgi:hypothetical protein
VSAQDNLSKGQFEQLDMFKPAKELRGMPLTDVQAEIWNRGGGGNYQRVAKVLMARKVRQAKRKGLYDSIKEHGVQKPVQIGPAYGPGIKVIDGHHRIASAMAIDPKMLVPVEHRE